MKAMSVLQRHIIQFCARLAHATGKMEGVMWLIRCGLPKRVLIKLVLAQYGAHLAENCEIETGLTCHNANPDFGNLTVGVGAHIGKGVFLDLADRVVISDHAVVSMRTMIMTHIDMGSSPLSANYPTATGPVVVGPGAYVGAGAILLKGITIGERSVVAAGAVVTRDVPPHSMVAGVPARHVKAIQAAK
jgi:acetyltransferase-like isoleucine patch superfamily enzyme